MNHSSSREIDHTFLKMINERNLTLDHPSENSVSAVHDTFETTSTHQAYSDVTEGINQTKYLFLCVYSSCDG